MLDITLAEAGELNESRLADAEQLVRSAFGDHFRTHDWLHAVGGVHVLVSGDQTLLAHAAVIPRTLRHDGAFFDTGYVEAVAVRADQQGRGLGRLVMDQAESLIAARHDIGALNAVKKAVPFYANRGWQLWDGPTRADTGTGTIDTYDRKDLIFLWPPDAAAPLAATTPLICDWRDGDLW